MQEIVSLILKDGDFENVKDTHVFSRALYLENTPVKQHSQVSNNKQHQCLILILRMNKDFHLVSPSLLICRGLIRHVPSRSRFPSTLKSNLRCQITRMF